MCWYLYFISLNNRISLENKHISQNLKTPILTRCKAFSLPEDSEEESRTLQKRDIFLKTTAVQPLKSVCETP
jgi:hypothetical protein